MVKNLSFRIRRPILGMLTAIAVAGSSIPSAVSASPPSAHYSYSFTHPVTGESFFNVFLQQPDGSWDRRVIFRTPEGEWRALPDHVWALNRIYGDKAYVWTDGLTPEPFDGVYYDAAKDELVAGEVYDESPNGKFGLRTVMYFVKFPSDRGYEYGYGYEKRVAVFLKNKQNGVLRQIADDSRSLVHYWLPDGTLLQQRFNEKEKQNEIVRIHPDTGETKRVILASLRGYNEKIGLMLYAYNEPTRKLYIYNFHDGTSRPAGEGEEELFYNAPVQEQPKVPGDLDIAALPVAATAYRQYNEATLKLDGKMIPLPYAYFGIDGKLYVPIRPLLDSLGWRMERTEGKPEYEYTIETGKGSITVDKMNSDMLRDRLFVDSGVIRTLYEDLDIEWNAF